MHKNICNAGPKEKLNSTVISQPAIYVASLAALEKLRQDKGDVHFFVSSSNLLSNEHESKIHKYIITWQMLIDDNYDL